MGRPRPTATAGQDRHARRALRRKVGSETEKDNIVGRENRYSGIGDPERRQQRQGSGVRRQQGYVGRAQANDAGRSGYGSESVRPYLRAQLRLKELMANALIPANPWDKPGRKVRGRNEDR